jgi:alcohol dehydrogenase
VKALLLDPTGPVVRQHALAPRPGEALLRPTVAGVCATDLELIKGYMGFHGVLGHEWVGRVERADDPALVGKRVVGDINCPCGRCPTCRAGRPTHCPDRTVLGIAGRDGAFAEALHLPEANLHVVPDGVPDEAAVFVEPLAAACEILQQVHVRPTDEVIVLGVGRLGQLCARVLALTGASVRGVSRNPARLALLPPTLGRATLAETQAELESRPRVDLVVDCTGSPDGLALAAQLVRPRGTLVLKTTTHDLGTASPTPWVIDELTLVGSRCGPFAPALRLLESRRVDPLPLVSAELPLSDAVAALALAAGDAVKVLLRIGE